MGARYQPEDVRADLLYLRKGRGYTAERLASRPALVSILGGKSERAQVLRERLESAIQSLHDDDAKLLMEVFGLNTGRALTTLAARRDAVGCRLGVTREAVADRDSAAIERLLRQLITGWYPKSPAGIRIPESHNGFVHHGVRVVTCVRDGRHLESQHHYRLFALFDGVEYLAIATGYLTSPVPVGTDFTVRTVELAGGWEHQFWRREPMRRGRTYDLVFRVVNPTPDEPEWITEESMAFHEPTRFAEFEVVFLGKQPQAIWSFRGLTAHERPGTPTNGTVVTLGDDGRAKAQFADVYGGLYCGVAWAW